MNFQIWGLLCALPPFLIALDFFWRIKRSKLNKKWPITEPLLRPAGESLRLKIDEYNDQLIYRLFILMLPALIGVAVAYQRFSAISGCILIAVSIGFSVFAGRRLTKTIKERSNYYLGFQGERAVGQHLNQILERGYKLYHDLQFEGFNIDHVIIGPSGIYAVETKTFRKELSRDAHKVAFDGEKLIFPHRKDLRSVEQAQRSAKDLSKWLSKTSGQNFWVEPVLTLPGWWIERRKAGAVNVLNPKEIVKFVMTRPQSALSTAAIAQVCYQVEQKSLIPVL